jgi:hypothetical protein
MNVKEDIIIIPFFGMDKTRGFVILIFLSTY